MSGSPVEGGVAELCRRDRGLAALVDKAGPPPVWAREPGFATLVRIILEQQVSLASARAVFERLESALGSVTPRRLLAGGEPRLRAIGFSRQKSDYCLGLARRVVEDELELAGLERLGDEDARARLTTIRGIGPWTADIYLLMALRRQDVWPVGDQALAVAARSLRRWPAAPSRDRLERLARPWRPWRSVAARILWQHYLSDLAPGRRGRDER
ncbi:MAG: DNA-3-methyladenine glycosylase 2 family protein [Acidobacteriota bacterium]|nr:DNA-3-methyladenine glycosylase 2 family protein [Acidobacteriota bacterium]